MCVRARVCVCWRQCECFQSVVWIWALSLPSIRLTRDAQNIDFFLVWNCIFSSIRIPSGSTNALTAGAFDGKGVYSDDPLPCNGPGGRAACLPAMISNTHTDKAYTRSKWSTNRLQSFHHLYKILNRQQLAQSNTHFLHGWWRHIRIGVGGEETGCYTGTQFRFKEAERRTNKSRAKVKMYWLSKTGLCLTIKRKQALSFNNKTKCPFLLNPVKKLGWTSKTIKHFHTKACGYAPITKNVAEWALFVRHCSGMTFLLGNRPKRNLCKLLSLMKHPQCFAHVITVQRLQHQQFPAVIFDFSIPGFILVNQCSMKISS